MTIVEAERGVFEALRRATVTAGYLPDIQTVVDADSWAVIRHEWESDNPDKKIIDVQGIESPQKRGKLKVNTIYVNLEDLDPSDIGTYGATFFTLVSGVEGEADAVYNQEFYSSGPEDGVFEIYYKVDSVAQDRIMRSIVKTALDTRHKYILGADDAGVLTAEHFLMDFGGTLKNSNDNNSERVYRYIARDLWEDMTDIKSSNLKAFKTAILDIRVYKTDEDINDDTEGVAVPV